MSASRTVEVVITGRVQGVSYRAWTADEARRRGLDGHVRNRADGAVEALFSGPEAAVDALIEACRAGPPTARVDAITVRPAAPPQGGGFRILG